MIAMSTFIALCSTAYAILVDTEKAYRATLVVSLHLRASQTLQQTGCEETDITVSKSKTLTLTVANCPSIHIYERAPSMSRQAASL